MDQQYQITCLYFQSGGNSLLPTKEENSPYFLFSLYLKGDWYPILSLSLLPVGDGHWETHVSALDRQYRNKGYGAAIYNKAILYALKNGINLCSSAQPSFSVKRVWQSLLKKHPIKYFNGRYRVL
jgi:GNAT superfamily N-acetyltransferase